MIAVTTNPLPTDNYPLSTKMFLGIEIGGTKIQLGVGPGDGSAPAAFERLEVKRRGGGEAIRRQVAIAGRALIEQHPVAAVGVGFGGPIDPRSQRTVKSHQVEGWDDFPLADWCRHTFQLPAVIANDADAAGLAEARFGAGRGRRIVFYITVGSGIGGALIIDAEPYAGSAGIAAELGHLRPGLQADRPDRTVESRSSGWAIAKAAKARLVECKKHKAGDPSAAELLELCGGQIDGVTTRQIGRAAAAGNRLALDVLRRGVESLGWAVAQMITLLAPEVVVVGGGVGQLGEQLFFSPLREQVERYVFPPLAQSYRIVPAALGEAVVVHGALALAAQQPA